MVSIFHATLLIPALAALSALAQSTEPVTPERRGDILMARKMYREAIDVYKEAPLDSAVIWNKLGIAYHQLTLIDEAKKHYQMAIKLNPQYSEAINNLGTVYYAKKSYRRAIAQYHKALKLAPKSASLYSNLGTAEFSRKKYKEATEAYQMALSLDPEVFEHRNSYGTLLQERSVTEKARFHYYLAKTYASAGNNERAIQYIRMALEEGFKERQKLMEEPEFAKLRETDAFKELMATEPRVL
jgi:tetratricopeptide (TPR) repeat protein